jgi:hypothetical protein
MLPSLLDTSIRFPFEVKEYLIISKLKFQTDDHGIYSQTMEFYFNTLMLNTEEQNFEVD